MLQMFFSIKGRVSNFWKPMLIFEITKTNTPLPQKGFSPILINLSHIYVAYATLATISSVKHKELFHRNYLEKLVSPGPVAVYVSIAVEVPRTILTQAN